jgi:uncharacterized protein with PIN domain
MVEACGVPHTEVDLMVVDGESVGFDYQVQHGDRIAVYPVFESFDITPIVKVRPEPLRRIAFVADNHLGRLARFLRLLGFDTVYDPSWDDDELAEIVSREGRILLTRDIELLKRNAVTHGYFVRAKDPRHQVVEVARRFHLDEETDPFTRCMVCNQRLDPVEKAEIRNHIPERTGQRIKEYKRCVGCGKIYWRGSHHDDLARIVETVARTRHPGAQSNP